MKDDDCSVSLLVPDDEKFLEVFRHIRWGDGLYCPKCGSKNVIKHGKARRVSLHRYACKECSSYFDDLTGTIFSNKRIPLGESFYIITQLDKKTIKTFIRRIRA